MRDLELNVLCLKQNRIVNNCTVDDPASHLQFARADGQENSMRLSVGSKSLCALRNGTVAVCGDIGNRDETDMFKYRVLPNGFVAFAAFDRYCQVNVRDRGSEMKCVADRPLRWEAFDLTLVDAAEVSAFHETLCTQHVIQQSMRQPLPEDSRDYYYYCGGDNKNKGMTRTRDLFGYSIHFGLMDRHSPRWQSICPDVRHDIDPRHNASQNDSLRAVPNDNACFQLLLPDENNWLRRHRVPYVSMQLRLATALDDIVTQVPPMSSSFSVAMLHLRRRSRFEPSDDTACSCNVRLLPESR
ncbi:MAG: hypothetical protein MHM6MM_001620 [Cercozoa sp. M6MM]